QDLNTPKGVALRRQLYGEAITVVNNEGNFLPIKVLDTIRFASVSLGAKGENYFQNTLSKYAKFDHYNLPDYGALSKYFDSVANKLSQYNVVVVGLHTMGHSRSKNYNLTPNALEFLQKIQTKSKVIFCVFGNAYSLRNLESASHALCAYEDNDATQTIAPQVIFGALPADGKLPVTASPKMKLFKGETLASIDRLKYSLPYMAGMNDFYLNKIDSIANKAIAEGATPGCQVLIAKDGHVVYQKNFGYLTYDKSEPVTNESLYDIASVTKVAATLQAIMFLQERGMVKLDTPVSAYIPDLIGTNKEKLLIRDIMVHQAGLQPFLEHWKRTMALDRLLDTYYCDKPDDYFTTPVSNNLYVACFMLDSIWKWTMASKLVAKEGDTLCYPYKYSDIGF
ncbi:MAG: beta-lactamase family protein, partial [Cytophagales bacterium]|nr:beta-lactamase family protein [Cytophagales bacterium]